MLPGIRFLLAAIVLSTSLLIFGLGAAALLRAAHEEVANVPARRVMAEPVFAPRSDAATPTLALLRVDPVESATTQDAPAAALPEPQAEAAPDTKVEPERLSALKLDETAAAEAPATLPAPPEPMPAAEPRLAALEATSPPSPETAPVAFEQVAAPAMTDTDAPPTRIAALGDPSAKAETPNEARKTNEKPDRAEIRRNRRAERARERRRQAARRARLAAQQATIQQATDPFSEAMQPTQPAATTTSSRRR